MADGSADASHRGGSPGFVAVQDERRLSFPDYAGNTMFMTLGNIAANPRGPAVHRLGDRRHAPAHRPRGRRLVG
jgi:hypothetical protein